MNFIAEMQILKRKNSILDRANGKLQAENEKLKAALEVDKTIFQLIAEDHCRPRKIRSNTHGKCVEAIERINQALKGDQK